MSPGSRADFDDLEVGAEKDKSDLFSDQSSKQNRPILAVYIFLILASACLVGAYLLSSDILLILGLGLAFWAGVFWYVSPEDSIPSSVASLLSASSAEVLSELLKDQDLKGNPIYLFPTSLDDWADPKICVSKTDESVPKDKQLEAEGIVQEPQGLILSSLGKDLAIEILDKINIPRAQLDFGIVKEKLPKIFTESFGLFEEISIQKEDNSIGVHLKGKQGCNVCVVYRNKANLHSMVGCPICSSIATIFSLALQQNIRMVRSDLTQNNTVIENAYEIVSN